MDEKKDAYRDLRKKTFANGGEPVIKTAKREVIFDPSNQEHMEAARVLFYPDLTSQEKYNEDKAKKEALTFKFKVEAGHTSVRTMVEAKIVAHVFEVHRARYHSRLVVVPLHRDVISK